MQVAKWGNSLAVRLPTAVVRALRLSEGGDVRIHVLGERDMAIERGRGRAALLERLDAFAGRLPEDFVFDRDDAQRD